MEAQTSIEPSKETLELYNNILKTQISECYKHKQHYKLHLSGYDAYYDAIGLTYYIILDMHINNKELVEYAREKFLK